MYFFVSTFRVLYLNLLWLGRHHTVSCIWQQCDSKCNNREFFFLFKKALKLIEAVFAQSMRSHISWQCFIVSCVCVHLDLSFCLSSYWIWAAFVKCLAKCLSSCYRKCWVTSVAIMFPSLMFLFFAFLIICAQLGLGPNCILIFTHFTHPPQTRTKWMY